ncbi:hypothetical protein OG900_20070 [Streptomyces sp. NBC_00433]
MSTWTIDQYEARTAAMRGRALEGVRFAAQSHAYDSDEPRHVRLRWAAVSLDANRRGHGDDPWDQARMHGQDFMLRTWIIEHLGAGAEPAWNPDVLAADTLAALTLDPAEAMALSSGWGSLPIEQLGHLRRHRGLTAHLDRLIGHLEPGPARDLLAAWIEVRKHLP